jgi:iron uptake system EfeUOB component EfeO/EfeM
MNSPVMDARNNGLDEKAGRYGFIFWKHIPPLLFRDERVGYRLSKKHAREVQGIGMRIARLANAPPNVILGAQAL